jgi:hypothetical protein
MPGREAEDMPGIGSSSPSAGADRNLTPSAEAEGPVDNPWNSEEEDVRHDQDTRIMEPIPDQDEIRITATNWLEEVDVEDGNTLEWHGASRAQGREPIDTPTVRHLFPVPDDADWRVRELEYDHYRRDAS